MVPAKAVIHGFESVEIEHGKCYLLELALRSIEPREQCARAPSPVNPSLEAGATAGPFRTFARRHVGDESEAAPARACPVMVARSSNHAGRPPPARALNSRRKATPGSRRIGGNCFLKDLTIVRNGCAHARSRARIRREPPAGPRAEPHPPTARQRQREDRGRRHPDGPRSPPSFRVRAQRL